jgi:hypothetical protein
MAVRVATSGVFRKLGVEPNQPGSHGASADRSQREQRNNSCQAPHLPPLDAGRRPRGRAFVAKSP